MFVKSNSYENETRKIEKVELSYFLGQSKSRLTKIRSGRDLYAVLQKQRMQNSQSLKVLDSARDGVWRQVDHLA